MKNLFYCKDGSLTDYALACDYVHRLRTKNNMEWLELKKIHSIYEVSAYNFETSQPLVEKYFNSLVEAKKFFYKEAKRLYNKTKQQTIIDSTNK